MKKIFMIIALVAMNMAAATAQSTSFDLNINEQGLKSILGDVEEKLADTRRYECVQLSTGEIRKVEVDGFYLGINGGGTAMLSGLQNNGFKAVAPTVGITLGGEGLGLGRWRNADGELHAFRRFGAEICISGTIQEYDPSAYSAGRKYYSYSSMLYGKFAIIDGAWVQNRLNLVAGAGYLYCKDNSHVVEVETATSIDNYYVYYTGSGLCYGGGLEYSFRPSMSTLRVVLRGTVENIRVVRLNEPYREWTVKVTLGITFGLGRDINRR